MANSLSTRKLFSIVFLICLTFMSPLEAKWTLITDGYLGSVFLDFDTLKAKKKSVTVWQLQDFSKVDLNGVRSRRLLIEVNCLKKTRRIIYLSGHSEQMAKGKVILINAKPSIWEEALPKSLAEKVMIAVCKNNRSF